MNGYLSEWRRVIGFSSVFFFFFSFCILTFLPKANNFLVINIAGNGYAKGSIEGISTSSATDKVWLVSQALGDIAFAYPYSLIVIEIQV